MRALTAIAAVALLGLTGAAHAGDYVSGYTRSDGTYVAPHYRSSPDSNRFNNYGSKGNVNPYTGEAGKVDPYGGSSAYGGYSSGSRRSKSSYGW